MAKHLMLDVYYITEHPQSVMRNLGITYQHATPQSITDCWQFWNCENVPDPLPDFLTEFETNPFDHIGYGLSQKDAEKIANYPSSLNQTT